MTVTKAATKAANEWGHETMNAQTKNAHIKADSMSKEKVAIVGLGYVGLPLTLALGRSFPSTIGFDVSKPKIEMLKRGEDPCCEGLEEDIRSSTVDFTADPTRLKECSFIIVAVPTPIDDNRQPDLRPLISASTTVGGHIGKGAVVVFESTVYPGVTEEVCGPILERESGLTRGKDFFLGYSPERINPGDKEHTLERIVKVIAAENDEATERLASVYGAVVKAGLHRAASIRVAEAAKVIENTQRDLNIALMNELAIIFDRMNLRTKDVLEAAGTKWNFLRFSPGLVGGHCIGVDPYYLTAKAQQLGYNPQVILAGRRINDDMGRFIAQRAVKLMITSGMSLKGARVGILGITFKENVTDTRNSRVPDIVRELDEFGIEAVVCDPVADCELVHEEYGVSLVPFSELRGVNALVIAVAHDEFKKKPAKELCELLAPGGVVIDVKSMLNPRDMPDGVVYWSL
jgi:UDP-N-acetyl-D-galactosamine dehydrogenase